MSAISDYQTKVGGVKKWRKCIRCTRPIAKGGLTDKTYARKLFCSRECLLLFLKA